MVTAQEIFEANNGTGVACKTMILPTNKVFEIAGTSSEFTAINVYHQGGLLDISQVGELSDKAWLMRIIKVGDDIRSSIDMGGVSWNSMRVDLLEAGFYLLIIWYRELTGMGIIQFSNNSGLIDASNFAEPDVIDGATAATTITGRSKQSNEDKLRQNDLEFKLRTGEHISEDDSVFLVLGNSLLVRQCIANMNVGYGFNGLKALGLSDSQAYKIIAIFNVKLDVNKYESEKALEFLGSDLDNLKSFSKFLAKRNIEMPSLKNYIAVLRSDNLVYNLIRDWAKNKEAN
ncbi:MAG: hypothetical protein K9K84_11675 [Methylovulum sp.]|nr:hypothetical protein [Methylovulum sp.]